MAPKLKRRKADDAPSNRAASSLPLEKDTSAADMNIQKASTKKSQSEGAKIAPKLKRRKVDDAPPNRTASSLPREKDASAAASNIPTPNVVQSTGVHPRIQQAKNYAVAQAQQEGCMGNFKIFDSPFGNFLVPVIPTRAELGG